MQIWPKVQIKYFEFSSHWHKFDSSLSNSDSLVANWVKAVIKKQQCRKLKSGLNLTKLNYQPRNTWVIFSSLQGNINAATKCKRQHVRTNWETREKQKVRTRVFTWTMKASSSWTMKALKGRSRLQLTELQATQFDHVTFGQRGKEFLYKMSLIEKIQYLTPQKKRPRVSVGGAEPGPQPPGAPEELNTRPFSGSLCSGF